MSGPAPQVRIIEHDPRGAIYVQGVGERGTIEVITNLRIEGDTAVLDQLHVDGLEPGRLGVRNLRRLARELGRQLGVKTLVIQGGRRTTGANPGRIPRRIVIHVEG